MVQHLELSLCLVLHFRVKMNQWSAAVCAIFHLLIFARAIETNTAITIVQRNLTVRDGEIAMFMCEAPCSHNVHWFIGDIHNSLALPYTDSLDELSYTRSYSDCNSADRYNDTISVLATGELDKVPVQCSASMIDCSGGDSSCSNVVYSRFRFLRVDASESSPSPITTSSSELVNPTPCPSYTAVLVTSIETQLVTSSKTVTTTETVTKATTVTISPTSHPQPTAPTCVMPESSCAKRSPSLLSRLPISPLSLLLLVCLSVLVTWL